jgi:large subunit ribosomal protein L29
MALKDAERKPLDLAQLRELPDDELRAELVRLQEAQFRLRLRAATEDISQDNPMRFRTVRRNIARIQTVLRERVNG